MIISYNNGIMELVLITVGVINVILLTILIIKMRSGSEARLNAKDVERLVRIEAELNRLTPQLSTEFRESRREIADNLQINRKEIETSFRANRQELATNLQSIQRTVDVRVKMLQDENSRKLEQMRETVDEKLQASVEKRFNESFKHISGQLTQVYEGLGEMRNLATGVGDLKKMMEGVKTRGIYGEVQLGAIIADILTSAQYEENIITKKGTKDRVEFAVKMPGQIDGQIVYLPIDSKFPVENYSRLLAAYDAGDKVEIGRSQKALALDVKEQAKKIAIKYIDPPATTAFGIMFVPTESLYAEILRIPGLYEEVRQKFNITIVSPSTLPVVLSGLLMGFRTVAIEKRSAEVWQTLGAVKTQFGKFGDLLAATKKKLTETANKIGAAETTSRQIERKLNDVEALPEVTSTQLIGDIAEGFSD